MVLLPNLDAKLQIKSIKAHICWNNLLTLETRLKFVTKI